MRELADTLDKWAGAMATSYASKTGKSTEEMVALLTDGEDHYYTASEALAAGFIDSIVDAQPVAASAFTEAAVEKFRKRVTAPKEPIGSQPSAAPAAQCKESVSMPVENPQAAAPQPAEPTVNAQEILAAEKARRTSIRAQFQPFTARAGVPALLEQLLDDTGVTPEAAGQRLLAVLAAEPASPVGHVVTVEDEDDKRRASVSAALLARAGVATPEIRAAAAASEFRGMRLLDLARASLQRGGFNSQRMSQMEVVAAAFTQSTSDFPVLLENTMHKALLSAYATAPDTWSRFCARGSVSDFRAHNRYRLGSLGNLDSLTELAEYTNKPLPDGEKAQISATTRGNIINLSRQMVINDDLGAFVGVASMLGRAAARTIEATVYALLAENAGLGPTMLDGDTLFHANHGNITTGAALASAALDLDRVAMASQMDISGNDYLDLRPAVLLVPLSLGSTARVINDAQYDPDTANKLQKPNSVRGLFSDVVDTPRMTGTRRYLFAAPTEAAVLEVAFLDGNDTPYVEQEAGFSVDGTRYKVRLDFGVAAVDYRGAVTNAGV
jgi:hypothetical protein